MCGNNCGYGNCGFCGNEVIWIVLLLLLVCGNGFCGIGCGNQNHCCCCDHGNQGCCCDHGC